MKKLIVMSFTMAGLFGLMGCEEWGTRDEGVYETEGVNQEERPGEDRDMTGEGFEGPERGEEAEAPGTPGMEETGGGAGSPGSGPGAAGTGAGEAAGGSGGGGGY